MKIAAFDTSSSSGSVAILDDDQLVAELTIAQPGVHAQWLLKAFDALLRDAGVCLQDIDLFAVGAGPGSFTGLRIGISAVKGLAWACGRPVAGVSVLEALAMNLRGSKMAVCPILDARKGDVYAALYGLDADISSVIIEEAAFKPDDLFQRIRDAGQDTSVVFIGSGLVTYKDAVKENLPGARFAQPAFWHVRALNVGLMALAAGDKAMPPSGLRPVYLRKSEVEAKTTVV
ncbi:MAG: tRNA (adenosine(37)-N6)-threonylcarbamoyltransferase complex dimerization subunit type 1 TsaB [Deltaproteobacteria bacterium RIFCSPLOWO2_02_FULL_53_8]|nr:MAG: tRNA (adenosine(37)-N6)-threonylcarbamoyltransferase complex dimerization subunit type 1 TsaB [Deltaproteobacteria bacterium RIFCSPLOWO2_02_FULL_53_8]